MSLVPYQGQQSQSSVSARDLVFSAMAARANRDPETEAVVRNWVNTQAGETIESLNSSDVRSTIEVINAIDGMPDGYAEVKQKLLDNRAEFSAVLVKAGQKIAARM